MALDLGTLRAYLDLDAKGWDTALTGAQDKVQKFGGSVPTWMGVASGAIVAGGIVAAGALYQLGSTWDDVGDTIRVQTGATGDELEGLIDVAKKVAQNVPVDIAKIAPALADVNQTLGLTGDDLQKVTEQILEAGRMLGEDLNLDVVSGSMNAFGVESDQISGKLDYLWQVSQGTGIGMNDLMAKLESAAPITQQLGFSMEDTAAMIGSMDKAGLDSQTMIGAMQRGLAKMTEPGEDAASTFQRVTGEIQAFVDQGDDAAARDLAGQVFGTKGAAQFVGALQNGALNLADLSASAGLTGDSIMDASADTADFAEKWQLVQNKASAALEPLASEVFAALGGALDYLMPMLTDLGQWVTDNPEAVQQFAIVLGVLAAAFVVLTIAVWAANAAFLANPVTWIIVAIVALIAAIVLLVLNWDTVVAWITEVWSGFISWITEVIMGFESWWRSVWEGFAGWISDLWAGFIGWISDLWQGYINWIVSVIVAFIVTWRTMWNNVSKFFSDLWAGIVGFVTDAWNNVLAFLGGIPQAILNVFTGAADWLYSIGEDILNGLWDGLVSIWNGLVGWIEDIGGTIADTFAGVLGIHSPSRVFREFGVNTIQGYMNGVDALLPELDRKMSSLPVTPEMSLVGAGGGSSSSGAGGAAGSFTYIAAEGQSLSSEEALLQALSSPRAKGAGE